MRLLPVLALWMAVAVAHAGTQDAPPAAQPAENVDEDSCLNDAVCYGLGKAHPKLDEHRMGLRALMAITPFGGLLIPRNFFFDDAVRPPFKGSVRRTSLLHGCGPCGCAGALPCTGVCLGPMGAVCGLVGGPLLFAIVLGVVGFVVIPIGGTIIGLCGGGLLGAPLGLVLGSILGVTVGPMLAMCLGCVPLSLWQLWIAPTSILHAYNQALDLAPPPGPPRDAPVRALPEDPPEQPARKSTPPPSSETPDAQPPAPTPAPEQPAPPPAADEGTTIK